MRKEDKLRPYRVDYFNIDEMKDNDLALVKSVVLRSVTAEEAEYQLLTQPEFWRGEYPSLVVIRSHRFYKKLGARKKDVYKAVEDLFTANRAVAVMEQIEAYRAKQKQTNDLGNTSAAQAQMDAVSAQADAAGHTTRFSDSSLYDEVCTKCGATDTSGKLNQPCPAAPPVTLPAIVPAPPTSGPESPATIAVVADMQGMISHDEHEQAMDTFVPTNVPEGKRFPTNAPLTLDSVPMKEHDLINPVVPGCPQCEQTPAGRAPTSWTLGLGDPVVETPIVPDQAVGSEGRPPLVAPAQDAGEGDSLLFKVAAFGVITLLVITGILFLLHH